MKYFWKKYKKQDARFQHILAKYLPFPHPGISLMTKDLDQIKLYTYFFNIEDAKSLVKLKEK